MKNPPTNKRVVTPGENIGGLTILKESEPRVMGKWKIVRMVSVLCVCGKVYNARAVNIYNRLSKSCGCLKIKAATIHGKCTHPLYGIWKAARRRCFCKTHKYYSFYGGRGITVSDEFNNDFQVFYEYVTALTKYQDRVRLKLSLDRIDNNKGYERGNLRWATKKEQGGNRRNRRSFAELGKQTKKSLAQTP